MHLAIKWENISTVRLGASASLAATTWFSPFLFFCVECVLLRMLCLLWAQREQHTQDLKRACQDAYFRRAPCAHTHAHIGSDLIFSCHHRHYYRSEFGEQTHASCVQYTLPCERAFTSLWSHRFDWKYLWWVSRWKNAICFGAHILCIPRFRRAHRWPWRWWWQCQEWKVHKIFACVCQCWELRAPVFTCSLHFTCSCSGTGAVCVNSADLVANASAIYGDAIMLQHHLILQFTLFGFNVVSVTCVPRGCATHTHTSVDATVCTRAHTRFRDKCYPHFRKKRQKRKKRRKLWDRVCGDFLVTYWTGYTYRTWHITLTLWFNHIQSESTECAVKLLWTQNGNEL